MIMPRSLLCRGCVRRFRLRLRWLLLLLVLLLLLIGPRLLLGILGRFCAGADVQDGLGRLWV